MEIVSVKAYIPRHLRRLAFAQFALQEMTFSTWVRTHLEQWLEEIGTPREVGAFAEGHDGDAGE
jgi:hypothetical protein